MSVRLLPAVHLNAVSPAPYAHSCPKGCLLFVIRIVQRQGEGEDQGQGKHRVEVAWISQQTHIRNTAAIMRPRDFVEDHSAAMQALRKVSAQSRLSITSISWPTSTDI
jgi:hypothetical protein